MLFGRGPSTKKCIQGIDDIRGTSPFLTEFSIPNLRHFWFRDLDLILHSAQNG